MFCGKCGKEIDEKDVFCPYCGAQTQNATAQAPAQAPVQPQTTPPVQPQTPNVVVQPSTVVVQTTNVMPDSYFDGGLLQQFGWRLLGAIVTAITLGICFPWAICMIYRWEAKHTVINGRRLRFTGTAAQLFGNWIKWALLTVITLGIYGLGLGIKLKKWEVKHTVFESAF